MTTSNPGIPTVKRDKAYAIELLYREFEGDKQILLRHELWWCKMITRLELINSHRLLDTDAEFFTLACFFLLYLDQEI